MKKIFIALLLIIITLGAIGYYFLGSINSIVKQQIEQHGSNALQTSVNVDNVNIKLIDGLGEISGFSIANPDGFSAMPALSFKTIRLDIDTQNITSMPIIIEEVLVDSVSSLYELNAQGSGNLNQLLSQANKGKGSKSAEETPASQDSASDTDIRLVIKKLVIKDTQLALDLSALGDKKYTETLPTFAVSNIGGTEGLPPEALAQAMGKQVLDKLIKEAKEKQKAKLMDKAKDKVMEKLNEKGGEKLKGLLNKFGA